MKKQLLPVTAFLLSFITNAQTGANDLGNRQLRGKVKSITEVEYEVVQKFGEPEKGEKRKIDFREYNSAGYETQHHLEDFTRAGEKTIKAFRYKDKAKLVEIREEIAGKVKMTKIEYNPQGRMGTVDFIDGSSNLEQRQKYRYDAEGLLTQIDSYKGDGSLYSKSVHTYNAKKQLVRKERYDEVGNLFDVRIYAYDASGNLAKETDVNFWAKTTDTISRCYRFNEKKQKVEESYSRSRPDSEKLSSDEFNESFTYNEQGDLVSKSVLYEEETIVYTYDQQNNWIKAVKTSGSTLFGDLFGKPKHKLVERQIKYY